MSEPQQVQWRIRKETVMTEDDLVGDGFHVPIEFHVSAGIESKYATNMVVHYQEHEFIIHFFEAYTPFFLGSPGELEEQRQSATSVRAGWPTHGPSRQWS